MESTNPAGRLHTILSKAQAVIKGGQPRNAVNVWASVFEIEQTPARIGSNETAAIISRLLQLRTLIQETEDSLKKIDGLPERYFRPFERIRAIPDQSLGALNIDIGGPILAVTEGDMTVLEFCSERLEERHVEPVISEDELQEVLQDVTSLFDDVKTSEIDLDLKAFILDGLESIRRGIYEFRIRGPERLKEAVAEIIGDFAVNHPKVQTPEDQDGWDKFNKTFRRFIAIGSFAHTGMKFLQAFTGPLLPGASDERKP